MFISLEVDTVDLSALVQGTTSIRTNISRHEHQAVSSCELSPDLTLAGCFFERMACAALARAAALFISRKFAAAPYSADNIIRPRLPSIRPLDMP